MSLPPGFLDELRSRTSLAQVAGRKVIWDARKSNQGKGDMWAPCPFHQEKTASFHVDDRQGFYYCFGCHAKGDAISFVRETENVDFMEAVRILSDEVGLQMPARDLQARQKADKRTQLSEVMEQAVRYFRLQLKTASAAGAREYLARRGLEQGSQDRFEIGFVPDSWQGLWDHLTNKGVDEELILGCGLAKPSSKGRKPYDTFRNRIIFPIRDARGKCIAFGGRAMDPSDNAKYLNSPETELFDKGRSLYNHGPAREAAGKGHSLIVAEGYMDVIALVSHGFQAAVAPLGTAVTEEQLRLFWRISPEPIIMLDGDTAGIRAAHRLIDLALPLLEAGQSLRFVILPQGKDPDDLLRQDGVSAMETHLQSARPMVSLLWSRETEGREFDSPERKAGLDKALREKIKLIRDPSVRRHYGDEIKRLRWNFLNPRQHGQIRQGGKWQTRPSVMPSTKQSYLVVTGSEARDHMRVAVILACLVNTPEVIDSFAADLERLDCADPDHAALRDILLRFQGGDLRAEIDEKLGPGALEKLMQTGHVPVTPAVRNAGDVVLACATVEDEFAKLDALRGWRSEISEAKEDITELADEVMTKRLLQAAETRNRSQRSTKEDSTQFDIAPNGARINRDEQGAFDALLEQIRQRKPNRS